MKMLGVKFNDINMFLLDQDGGLSYDFLCKEQELNQLLHISR